MKEKIRKIVCEEYSNTLGIVAYKNNKKVYEEYFNNANKDESVHTFSIAKSVVSILIGIAIDKGYIKSVNQKVLDFFPDYKLKRNQEQLKDLTIEHFLTMTVPYKYKYEPYTKVFTSENWGEKILELIGGKEQVGENFHYSTVGIQVLSNILTKATNMSLKEFAQEYLFNPLGIKDLPDAPIHDRESQEKFYKTRNIRGWAKDHNGYYTTGWGLSLTTDEFAQIGLLVLNNGMYDGKRIVSEKYIKEMTKEREKNYGYLWWIYHKNETIKIIRKEYNTGKFDSYCANGVGGSLIAVIPDDNIVICMTCSLVYNPKIRMELINNYLIPYIDSL
ncbi:MAG: serine hydrolase [Clostridia bacterium]|nr:serine hydrolase [Clostridia bacterium]